jgi:uncharacterized protein (TIGR02301 family)
VRALRSIVAGAFALGLATLPLSAQSPPAKPAAPAPVPTPPPSPTPTPTTAPPPPYEPQLLRLSELMGALSYLRDLCKAGDGAEFHDKMAKLLAVEAGTQERKDLLAGAFNRGFSDYSLTYRTCTASAEEIVARFLDESGRIARDIASRYGG